MTDDRARGYITDSSYEDRFFRELSPVWLNYVAALNGARPCALDRPFVYLELGCGFGRSIVVNASAFPAGEFYACDLNPQHVAGANAHARALGLDNVEVSECSFEEVLALDVPPVDFLVLHGVYSWVDAGARAAVRRVIDRKLKPSGLLYLSYNCFPGWAPELPLRKLMVELGASSRGDSSQRVRLGVEALDRLKQANFRYLNRHDRVASAVEAYGRASPSYVAHEFFNAAWEPFYSCDVADELLPLGLSYAGSATLTDNHPELVMDDGAGQALARLPNLRLRQLASDFAVERRFRRDVFVRHADKLSDVDVARQISAICIGSASCVDCLPHSVQIPRGELRMRAEFLADLEKLLFRSSMRLGDVVAALAGKTQKPAEVARNLLFLVAAGALSPFCRVYAASEAGTRLATPVAERALDRAIARGTSWAIPSQVLGNGVELEALEALALRDFVAGAHDVDTLARRLRERRSPATPLTHEAHTSAATKTSSGDATPERAALEFFDRVLPCLRRVGLVV